MGLIYMQKTSENNGNIVKSSIIVSGVVTFGKVLGFIKQSVIAWAFGANAKTDIFFAADGYTSMFGQMMMQSIGPTVLTHYVSEDHISKEKAEDLIRASLLFFPLLGTIIAAISILLSAQISSMIGISYDPLQRKELQFFLIALCPVIIFTSLTGVIQGYLDANNRFVPAKLCSLFFSVSIIIFVLLFHNKLGVKSLLYGFLAGYILHTIYMCMCINRKIRWKFVNPFRIDGFMQMLRKFLPLMIGTSIVDLGHLLDRVVASSLVMGSVSVLYFGQVISSDLVNAVIVTSMGTVLLPLLTKKVVSCNNSKEIAEILSEIINIMTFVAVLVTVLYMVEGPDLIKLFFERGSFTSENTDSVSQVAICYSLGFTFIAAREILIKAHYAFHDTLHPMINSIVGVIMNLIGNIILSRMIGVSGIAIATSVSMLLVTVLSLHTIKQHTESLPISRKGAINLLKIIIIGIISVACGLLLRDLCGSLFFVVRLFLISFVIITIYIMTGLVLKEKSVHMFKNKIMRCNG